MEVPRFWRNYNHMLNPNSHGYRPSRPSMPEPDQSAKLTCLAYNGDPISYAHREVRPYSEYLKDGASYEELRGGQTSHEKEQTEIRIPSGIVYQNADSGVAI